METTLTVKFRSPDPGKQEALFEAFDLVCMNPTDRRKYDGIADKDAEFLTRIEKLSGQKIPKNDLGYLEEIMEPESIMKRKNIILY